MPNFCEHILKLLNEISACNIDYSLFLKNRLNPGWYIQIYKRTWKYLNAFGTLLLEIY